MSVTQPTTLRKKLWNILHYGKGRLGHVFTFTLLLLILFSIAILPLEFIEAFSTFHTALITIEITLTAFFTVEYLFRLYAAPQRLLYIFSFFGIIDLLSIVPFYIGLIGTQYFRVFRLARLLRILKVARIEAAELAEESGLQGKELDLLEGETIEHVITKHPIFFLLGLVPVLMMTSAASLTILFPMNEISLSLLATFLLFAALFLYKAWLDYRYDVIYVTTHRLILQNWDLLGKDVNQIGYQAITNVKPQHTGIVSYLLGFGSIIIDTAAEQGSMEHKMVRSHEKSAHIIMQQFLQSKGRELPR